jgi:hypothetical protein
MPQLKGLNNFQKTISAAKYAAHQMRKELVYKEEWYNAKPDFYKRSKNGQKWARLLFEVNQLINDVEDIEIKRENHVLI